MSVAVDNRLVVLLKSRRTNNRFYALVPPESGIKNADAIDDFPPEFHLGIAYPCLEDGLNDFAVIRTTFETIDCFPDDAELRDEMMVIIDDARGNLLRRLTELQDTITRGQAHFLGTDLNEFKESIVHMALRGSIRRTLDNMMKVDVFDSVSQTAAKLNRSAPEPMYRYEFLPTYGLDTIGGLPPRQFIGRVFDDLLEAVRDDMNYMNKYTFDKDVFQKFIAVMFVNYATTDPMFYGTNRADYGVSADKDMNETPLYRAVGEALRELERGIDRWTEAGNQARGGGTAAPPAGFPTAATPAEPQTEDLSHIFADVGSPESLIEPLQRGGHSVEIPFGAENLVLDPLIRLAEVVRLLRNMDHPRSTELGSMVFASGKELFKTLQEMGILSPLAPDPMDESSDD
jgi:hypothetical protein